MHSIKMLSPIAATIDFQATDFKLIYIGLHFTILYFVIEFALRFILKSRDYDNERVKKLNLGLGVGFLYLIGIFGSQLIYHYYLPDGMEISVNAFNHLLLIIFGAMMFTCIAICEKPYTSRRIFTWLALATFIAFIIFPPDSEYIIYAFIGTAIVIMLPIWVGLKLLRTTGARIRNRLWVLAISAFIFYIGCILNLELIIPYLPAAWMTLAGGLFVVIGLTGVYFSLHEVDLFVESDWSNYLIEIFIIKKKQMQLVYHHVYRENLDTLDGDKRSNAKRAKKAKKSGDGSAATAEAQSDLASRQKQNRQDKRTEDHLKLFSGGLIGVDSITKNISRSSQENADGVSLIELGNQYLFMNTSNDMIFCFITSKNLDSMKYFLHKIRTMWERYYGNIDVDVILDDPTMYTTLDTIVQRVIAGKLKI